MAIQSVFISYSRDDALLVEPLEQALKDKGIAVWRDQHSVYGGVNWLRLIGEAIRDHDAVVLCWPAGPHYADPRNLHQSNHLEL